MPAVGGVGTNFTIVEDSGEADDSILTVIVTTIPGIPFLIMSLCVVFGLTAAFFLEDITKGMVGKNEPEEALEGPPSQSQSENSETKVHLESSTPDLQELKSSSQEHLKSSSPSLPDMVSISDEGKLNLREC